MTKTKGGPPDTGGPVEVPEIISILPLRNSVLFPGSIIPIDVGRRKSVRLVEEAIAKERPVIGIITQRDARTEDPNSGDLYLVGCAARILKVIKLAKDNFSVILQGVSRFEVSGFEGGEPFVEGAVARAGVVGHAVSVGEVAHCAEDGTGVFVFAHHHRDRVGDRPAVERRR